ncbi:MAG TPA: penicillin acylase family protein [Actinomycetota bacterium]|nr:penicillin acylase family protein [Actinomycetota bacterium]
MKSRLVVLAGVVALAFPALAAGSPPVQVPGGFRAATINTPGQSGHISVLDFAADTANGTKTYGPHLTDGLVPYTAYKYKPGEFFRSGTPTIPRPGVKIYRDSFGVPAVWGGSIADAWYGVGYALAEDRMWQMHLLRMAALGRLAELIGTGGLPSDIATRRDFYTPAEYAQQFASLDDWEKEQLIAYAAGVNQYIAEMHADPRKMPAEIAALALPIEPWTPIDSFALGGLIARSVASDGGQELGNAALLRDLITTYGATEAAKIFNDVLWRNDPAAPTSVPASEGTFSSYPHGAPLGSSLQRSLSLVEALPGSLPDVAAQLTAERAVRDKLRTELGLPRPGSNVWAVSPSRSANGNAMLFNGPQVGYTVAGLLTEFEVHGGRGDRRLDAKGITVAGFPAVGIGYTPHHAWGLTSGLSDTIDMYVEQLAGDKHSYRYDGETRKMQCRTELFKLRNTLAPEQTGIHTQELCRTVHGPVIAIDEAGGVAYAQRYAIWNNEIGTLRSMFRWPYAKNLEEFTDAMRLVTWNENLTYADAEGNIAYWHPGSYPARPRAFDERLPYPGDGSAEWERLLTFEEMPHTINPAQGWVANWNSKPSAGWTSGDPHYSDRPWGVANRLSALADVLGGPAPIGAIPAPGPDGLIDGTQGLFAPDVAGGNFDLTFPAFRPYLAEARAATSDPRLAAALDAMLAWDGSHFDANNDGKADTPGHTIFHEWVEQAARGVFNPYLLGHGAFFRGGHRTDPSPVINMFLRALQGPAAALPQSRDYLNGKTRTQVILETLDTRLNALQAIYGSNMNAWLMPAFRSRLESQGLGPGGSFRYQDRGSWIEAIEYFVD